MKFLKIKLLALALILFAAGSASASYSCLVTVDTSSLNGGTGILDFNFNSFATVPAFATISNFYTNGTLGAQNIVDAQNGGATVTGSLANTPPTVQFFNATYTGNEYIHGITFGNTLSFQVTMWNTGSSTQSGASTFSLGLFSDVTSWAPLLATTNGDGVLFQANLQNDGVTADYTNLSPNDTTVTPIPPSVFMFGAGLIGLVGVRRRVRG